MQGIQYSIVVPVYNAAATLESLVAQISEALRGEEFEMVLVNDASKDDSWEVLRRLTRGKPNLKIINLKENIGQMGATMCGIHHAEGKYIITIDDDLQYPPAEIKKLIHAFEEKPCLILFGAPEKRMHSKGHNLVAKVVMLLFDYLLLPRYHAINFYTSFRLFDRDLFFGEQNAYLKGKNLFFFWKIPPSQMRSIQVRHQKRNYGQSNQTFRGLIKYYRPLILWGILRTSIVLLWALPLMMLLLVWKNSGNFFPLIVLLISFFFVVLVFYFYARQGLKTLQHSVYRVAQMKRYES